MPEVGSTITLTCGCEIAYEPVHDDGCKCPECGIQKGGGVWSMEDPCEKHEEK